jgi:hypothetical protein
VLKIELFCYGTENQEIGAPFLAGQNNSFLLGSDGLQGPFNEYWGALFLGIKRSGREAIIHLRLVLSLRLHGSVPSFYTHRHGIGLN